MLYFLKLKSYEMHLFMSARLTLFTNLYPSPGPNLQSWAVLGDKEHNSCFNIVTIEGVGLILPLGVNSLAKILPKIVKNQTLRLFGKPLSLLHHITDVVC